MSTRAQRDAERAEREALERGLREQLDAWTARQGLPGPDYLWGTRAMSGHAIGPSQGYIPPMGFNVAPEPVPEHRGRWPMTAPRALQRPAWPRRPRRP
jgi:hypothetical protein